MLFETKMSQGNKPRWIKNRYMRIRIKFSWDSFCVFIYEIVSDQISNETSAPFLWLFQSKNRLEIWSCLRHLRNIY